MVCILALHRRLAVVGACTKTDDVYTQQEDPARDISCFSHKNMDFRRHFVLLGVLIFGIICGKSYGKYL